MSLQRVVDQVTRPRIFVALGLEPTPTGRDTLTASLDGQPCAPELSAGRRTDAAARKSETLVSRRRCGDGDTVSGLRCHVNTRRVTVLAILVAFLLGLLVAPGAHAHETPATLNEVARVYSLGVGDVRCASSEEWRAAT
jgi:hypothetical protein